MSVLANPQHGAPLGEFCDAVFAELVRNERLTIGYGPTAGIERASPSDLDAAFDNSVHRAGVRVYPDRSTPDAEA